MAIAQASSLVSRVSGKVGNICYYVHKGTQCVKSLPYEPADPNSEKQNQIRQWLNEFCQEWSDGSLADLYKYLWENWIQMYGVDTYPPGGEPSYPCAPRGRGG